MKTDMVNFTIQSLRPHLLQQAVQYERAKFQQILDKQPGEEDFKISNLTASLWAMDEEGDFVTVKFTVIAYFTFQLNRFWPLSSAKALSCNFSASHSLGQELDSQSVNSICLSAAG